MYINQDSNRRACCRGYSIASERLNFSTEKLTNFLVLNYFVSKWNAGKFFSRFSSEISKNVTNAKLFNFWLEIKQIDKKQYNLADFDEHVISYDSEYFASGKCN